MLSDAERAVALLRYANYAKVAEALLVSRASVADWAKGRSVTPYRLRQLEQLLRPDLQEETSPPAWAEGLADRTAAKVIGALADPEVLAALPDAIAALEALPRRSHDSAHANGGRQDQVGSKQ